MIKPNLYTERMAGVGPVGGINYLKGLDDLCKHFDLNKSKTVLELGCNIGVSTSLFAYYAKAVTSVDIVKTESMMNVVKKYGNITFKHGSVADIVPTLPDDFFDFIYVDALHDYDSAKHDILVSIPKLKRNGIMCGHDFYQTPRTPVDGVADAVNEIYKDREIIIFEDTSWAVVPIF